MLVQLEDPKIRIQALTQLIEKDIDKAVIVILRLLKQSKISLEDAVEMLYEEKPTAVEQLKKNPNCAGSGQLVDLLSHYNPYSGMPVVSIGSWVLTNAGWGKIDEILDPRTRISLDSFMEGDGNYLLNTTLHIYESFDLTGEKALVNMKTEEISFPRAARIYICPDWQDFTTAKLEIFKAHMISAHGRAKMYPGERNNAVPLTYIQFSQKPR